MPSFVAKSLDRIEARRPTSGKVAEGDAYGGRKHKGQQNSAPVEDERHVQQTGCDGRQSEPKQDADESTQGGERYGLDEKLCEDLRLSRANREADTDLACAFCH